MPGGAWMLMKLSMDLPKDELTAILANALMEPFSRLVENCGIVDPEEIVQIAKPIEDGITGKGPLLVYDFLEQKHVDPYRAGILDSTPSVLEAIRNALSIAGRVGTLGGVIVQRRDKELERSEAKKTINFEQMAQEDENPANSHY